MADTKPHFGYHFAKLHRQMIALCKPGIIELGLQPSHIPFVAKLLRRDTPLTQDELSAALVIDKAATARALDQLERKGLVRRVVNPENRRQKLVSATPKAKALEGAFFDILHNASGVLVQGFSKTDMEQALNLLKRMMANAVEKTS